MDDPDVKAHYRIKADPTYGVIAPRSKNKIKAEWPDFWVKKLLTFPLIIRSLWIQIKFSGPRSAIESINYYLGSCDKKIRIYKAPLSPAQVNQLKRQNELTDTKTLKQIFSEVSNPQAMRYQDFNCVYKEEKINWAILTMLVTAVLAAAYQLLIKYI